MSAELNKSKKNIAWEMIRKTGGYMINGVSDYFSDAMPNMRSLQNDVSAEINGIQKKMQTRSNSGVRQGSRMMRMKSGMRGILRWYLQEGEEYETAGNEADNLTYDTGEGAIDNTAMQISEQEKSANQISAAVTKGLQKNLEGQIELTSEINHTLTELNTTMSTGLDRLSVKIDEFIKVYTKNSSTQIEATVASARQQENTDPIAKMFREGSFNLKDYKKILSTNLTQTLSDYGGPLAVMAQQMLPMFLDLNLLKEMTPDKIMGLVAEPMIEKMLPGLKKQMQQLDKDISNGIIDMLLKAGENNTGNDKNLSTLVGKLFGIKPTRQDQGTAATRAELSDVGPVPFDRIAHETLVNTIPGYLREMVHLLGGKDMVYDYRKRTFRTQKDIDEEFRNTAAPTNMLNQGGMTQFKDLFYNDKFTNMAYDQMINDLRSRIEDGSYAKIIRSFDDKEQTREYLQKTLFRNVNLSESQSSRLNDMADSLADLKASNGLGALKDQVTRGNVERNEQMRAYINDAKLYNKDLRHLKDSYADDRAWIFNRVGLKEEGSDSENTSTVRTAVETVSDGVYGVDYTNMALYEIYRRLNQGVNVFQVGSAKLRKKPFEKLEDDYLGPPKTYRPKRIHDDVTEEEDLTAGTRSGPRVVDENGNPVNESNALLKQGDDDERSTMQRVGDWAKSRGGQLWQAMRHGDAGEFRDVVGASINDVGQVVGDKLKKTINKADKQFGNISGWLGHKLTGKEYEYDTGEVDENGNPVVKYIAKNEKGGLFGVAGDYLKEMFESPLKNGKDWVKDVLGYFDYGNDGTNQKDGDVENKRRRIMAAAVGAFAGAGILGGPVGMIAGAIAGNAVMGSGIGKKIQQLFFGRDEETGKAKGMLTKMGDAIIMPVAYQFSKTAHTLGNAMKRNVLGPLSDLGQAIKDRITSSADTAFGKVFQAMGKVIFAPFKLAGKVAGGITGLIPGLTGGTARGAIRAGTGLFGGAVSSMAKSISKKSNQTHVVTDEDGNEITMTSDQYLKYRQQQRKEDTEKFDSMKDWRKKREQRIAKLRKDAKEGTAEREMTQEEREAYLAQKEAAEIAKQTQEKTDQIEVNTAEAATAVSKLRELGEDKGSIYVHDQGVHNRLDQILQILGNVYGININGPDDHSDEVPDVVTQDASNAEIAGQTSLFGGNEEDQTSLFDSGNTAEAAKKKDKEEAEIAQRDNDNAVAAAAVGAAAQLASSTDGVSEEEAAVSKNVYEEASKPNSSAKVVTEELQKLQDMNGDGKAEAAEKKEKGDSNIIDKIFSGIGGGITSLITQGWPLIAGALFALSDDFRNAVLDLGSNLLKNLPSVIAGAWKMVKGATEFVEDVVDANASGATLQTNEVTGQREAVVSAEQHAADVEMGINKAAWNSATDLGVLGVQAVEGAVGRKILGTGIRAVGRGVSAVGGAQGLMQAGKTFTTAMGNGFGLKTSAGWAKNAAKLVGAETRNAGSQITTFGKSYKNPIAAGKGARGLAVGGALLGEAMTISSNFGWESQERSRHGNVVGNYGIAGVNAAGYVRTSARGKNGLALAMNLAGPLAAKGATALAALVGATGVAAAGVVAAVVVVVIGLAYGLGRLINSLIADHTNNKNIDYSVRSNATKMNLAINDGITYAEDGNDPMYVYCGQPADRCVGITDGETIANPEVVIGRLLYGIFFEDDSLPGAEILLHDVIKNMAVQGVPFAVGLVGDSKAVKQNGEQRNSYWGNPPLTGTGKNTQVLKSTVKSHIDQIMTDIHTNIARYGTQYGWDYEQDLKVIWENGEDTIKALAGAGILDNNGKVQTSKFKGDPGTNKGAGWDELEKLTRQKGSYFLLQSLIYINSKVDANRKGEQWIQTHQSQIEKLFDKLADFLKLEKDKAKKELMKQGMSESEAEAEVNGQKDPATALAKKGADTVKDTYQSYKSVERSSIRAGDRPDFAKELKYLSAAYAYSHPEMTIPWAQKNMDVSGLDPNYKKGNEIANWKNEKDSKKKQEMLSELAKVSMAYGENHGDIFGLMDLFDFREGGKVYPRTEDVIGIDSSKMYGSGFLIRGYNYEGDGTLDKLFEDAKEPMYKKKNPEEMHKILFGKKEHGGASEAGSTKNQDWTLGGSGIIADIASRIAQYGNTKAEELSKGDNSEAWRNILVNLPARDPKNLNVTDSAEALVKEKKEDPVGGPKKSNFNNADASIDMSAVGAAVAANTDGGGGGVYVAPEEENEDAVLDTEGGNPLNKAFRVTSGYGWRDLNQDGVNDDYHTGVDIAPADGSTTAEVGSRFSGTISKIQNDVSDSHTGLGTTTQTEGNQVWIDTDNGKRVKMMHLKSGSIPSYLKEGSHVEPGDFLGEMGSTGRSSGPHLHYQVENKIGDDNSTINPRQGIKKGKQYDSFSKEDRSGTLSDGTYHTLDDYVGAYPTGTQEEGTKTISNVGDFIKAIASAGSKILSKITGGLLGSDEDENGMASTNISLYDGTATASGSAADFLKFCANEIGTTESPPDSNRTKYGEWYGVNGQPWCMIFVQWCFSNYKIPLPYKTASCGEMIKYYKAHDPNRVLDGAKATPQPGDLIFFKWTTGGTTKHVGIVEAVKDQNTFITIEGNTSAGEKGSQDNGGGVYRRTRYRKNITYFIHAHDFVAGAAAAASIGSVSNDEEGIWKYLKKRGLSDQAAAGVMGNLFAESSLKSDNLQGSYEKKLGQTDSSYTKGVDSGTYTRDQFIRDSAGYGLAQWTYSSRKRNLYDFAKSRGSSIGDHNMQLDYFWQEIQEGQKPTVKTQLDQAGTVNQASDVMLYSYEAPANTSSHEAKRRGYSQQFYDRWKGIGGPISKDKKNTEDGELDLSAVGGAMAADTTSGGGTSTGNTVPGSDLPWVDPLGVVDTGIGDTLADGAGPVAMYGDLPVSSIQKPEPFDIQKDYLKKASQMKRRNEYYRRKEEQILAERDNPIGGPITEMPAPIAPKKHFSVKDDLSQIRAEVPDIMTSTSVPKSTPQVDLTAVVSALGLVTDYLSQIAENTGASTDQLGLLAENGFVDKDIRNQFEQLGKKLKAQSSKRNVNANSRANSRVVSNLVKP